MNNHRQTLLYLIADGVFHSGEALSSALGVSRTAVNKSIHQLRQLGLEIESRHGRGYKLASPLQLLDKERIRSGLSALAAPQCREIEILFETDSTNDYLAECIQRGPCSGKVVIAEYQSHGKGRRGNQWVSPVGSGLYLSLAWQAQKSYASIGLLSLFTGVAVVRVLSQLGVNGPCLKWPNDIYINDEKLGGILIEMQGEANGPIDVIVGVGINYELPATTRQQIDQPATDLLQHMSKRHSRNDILAALLSELFELFMNSDEQRETLLDEWRRYDCYKDKMARLLLPDAEVSGQLKGIDEDGCLLMSVNGQIQRFSCGEISLRVQT